MVLSAAPDWTDTKYPDVGASVDAVPVPTFVAPEIVSFVLLMVGVTFFVPVTLTEPAIFATFAETEAVPDVEPLPVSLVPT